MTYKSCGNCDLSEHGDCAAIPGLTFWECARIYQGWHPIPCPSCGGVLSEIREHEGKRYRHCYACHFEFEEEDKANAH